jgi:hypothetical protein
MCSFYWFMTSDTSFHLPTCFLRQENHKTFSVSIFSVTENPSNVWGTKRILKEQSSNHQTSLLQTAIRLGGCCVYLFRMYSIPSENYTNAGKDKLLLLIFLVYFSEANHSRDAFSIAKLPKPKEQMNYQVFLVIQPDTIKEGDPKLWDLRVILAYKAPCALHLIGLPRARITALNYLELDDFVHPC